MPLRRPPPPLQPSQEPASGFDAAKARQLVQWLEEALELAADAGMPDAAAQLAQALDAARAEEMRGGTDPED